MFGKKKRDRREEEDFLPEDPEGYASYPEEEEYPAEYAEEYPEEDAGYDDSGAGPDGIYDDAYNEGTDGEYPEEDDYYHYDPFTGEPLDTNNKEKSGRKRKNA